MQEMLNNILENSTRQIPIPRYGLPKVQGNILVLAPHFDDEIIGCGGAIHKYVTKNKESVHVIYVTDSKNGRPHDINEQDISDIRRREANKALEMLGVQAVNCHYLFLEDGKVYKDYLSKKNQLCSLMMQIKPKIIFVPYIYDIHPDHRATNLLLKEAIKEWEMQGENIPLIMMYEVWTPLIPNVCINITDVMDIKLKALLCHGTQLALMRYEKMVKSLNSFRAAFVNHNSFEYAEAFYKCELSEYVRLLRHL